MNFSYECNVDILSTTISLTTETTKKLYKSLFVYGDVFRQCTNIDEIKSDTEIIVTSLPLATGTFIVTFSDVTPVVFQTICEAQKEVSSIINQQGMDVHFTLRLESDIERDQYNYGKARIREKTFTVKAMPIDFSNTSDILQKAGIVEKHGAIVWVARYDFYAHGVNFGDIDEKRDTIKIDGETYRINEKNKIGNYGNEYLYWTFGVDRL